MFGFDSSELHVRVAITCCGEQNVDLGLEKCEVWQLNKGVSPVLYPSDAMRF